jgi:tetratricopeptide (TPR) repeat protein
MRSPVFWALLAALGVRLVVLAQLHGHPLLQPTGVLDSAVYVRLAERAAGGDWAVGPEPYFVSPLYIYFLAVLRWSFGPSLLLPRLVQALLGAAAVGLVGATAWRLFASPAVAGVAAWLAALTGVLVFHEILLLQSSLDPFLTALALYALARAAQGASVPGYALAGAAFGLLVANRPNALLAVAVTALAVVAVGRTRRSLLQAVALGAGLLLVLAPFALRNRLVAGEWILVSSHGGLNFYIGNNPEADGTYHSLPGVTPAIEGQARDARRLAEEALGQPLSASQVSSYFYERALAFIRAQPRAALALLARKAAYALNAVEVPLNYSYAYYAREEATLLRVLVVGSWLLVPLGLVGLVVHPRVTCRAALIPWASFIPAYLLSLALFFVSARYRLPVLVPLCVTAGAAAVQLVTWLRSGKRRPAVLAAAVLGALLLFSCWDLGLDDGRGPEASEMVLHHLAAGREAEAKALLARTEPLLDNPGLLYYRMGLGYLERGQPGAAAPLFARALEADPGQPDVQLSLGQALLATGRASEAEPHLRAVRDAGVAPLESGFDLARALAALGRRPEAVEALRRAASAGGVADGAAASFGMLALSLGAPDLAEPFLGRAASRQPASAEVREAHGLALAQLGRSGPARAALEEALRLDPSRASAHFNLAVLALGEGRREEARRLLESAVRLQPDYAQARDLMARLGWRS